MSDNKPTWVYYFWKYADEPFSLVKKTGVTGTLSYTSDSQALIDGTQNDFKIEGLKYRSACPAVDVFAVGINAEGQGKSPGFWNSGDVLTITEAGGIDGVETEFDVLGDAYAAMLAEGDHLETGSGEIMRVETITPGSPNYTLTVERGAHATTAAAALFESELEILTPNCGMSRITLTGDIIALDAPVLDSVNAVGEGLLLQWSHSYTGDDLAKLSHFKVYYSDAAAIDVSDPLTYDGTFEVAGNQNIKVFNPLDSNLPDVNTTFYFVVTAITQAQIESAASNELSGKAFGSIQPNPTGPPTPTVTVEVNGSYRLKVEAKKPTGTDSALGVSNVKKATIEVYYATAGLGNPTDGSPDGNQTLINSYEDSSLPYSVEIGVSGYGYKDYWARAYFTDGGDVAGSYGVSAVFELNAENNTTDTGISTGTYLNVLVDEVNPFATQPYGLLTIGIAATGNTDSADQCQIAFRVDGVGTFQADQDTPFLGATDTRSTPKTWGGYPTTFNSIKLELDRKWEVTGRIHNTYGWTDWLAPAGITFTGGVTSADTDVCDLAGFGAWTRETPPPGGWTTILQEPGAGQVVFDFSLPASNSSTVWSVSVEGVTAASFPSETVLKTQANGTMTAVPGGYEIVIAGFSATLNQYQNKYVRIGSDSTKNDVDTLQLFVVASNTAGDPFTITVTEDRRIVNRDPAGSVTAWQIVDTAIHKLVNYYEDFPINRASFGATVPKKNVFQANATGMKFRARVDNRFGHKGYRESDTTATGSLTPGTATYKNISGITDDDVKAASLTYVSVVEQLQPIAHSVVFTALTYRTFSWAAGSVEFPGGVTRSINSGSSATLSSNTTYWAYYTAGSSTLGVSATLSVAMGAGKTILAVIRTASAGTEFCTIVPRWGPGLNIGAASIVCDQLSAITADLGTVNAGTVNGVTIQTSATASTNGGIVLNGTDFTTYDTDGDELLKVDKTNGLTAYALNGDPQKVARIDHEALYVYDSAGSDIGVRILPITDTASIQTYWNGTIIGAIKGATSTVWTIQASAGVALQIVTDKFNVSTAGNITTGGTYISLIDGGAAGYLKIRDTNGSTKYAYSTEGVWTIGSSPP